MSDAATTSRGRILDAALALMSDRGVAGTSMRSVASACGLNVASLYHYFPSKADLLASVISERGYLEQLAEEPLPDAVRGGAAPDERLRRFVRWLWREAEAEEAVWRLIIGESLRGEAPARRTAAQLVTSLDDAIVRWLGEILPEAGDRLPALARLVRALLLDLMVEHLALGADLDRARSRIDDLVTAVLPASP